MMALMDFAMRRSCLSCRPYLAEAPSYLAAVTLPMPDTERLTERGWP